MTIHAIYRHAVAAACLLAASLPAHAVLKVGDAAPMFKAQAALGGKVAPFDLAAALKKGPVVLYFFPAAFTSGCNVEAHLFAEATEKFKAAGATVVGVSNDKIDTLAKFSVSECSNKFAVVSDAGGETIRAYDAKYSLIANAKRVSYVIAPNAKVMLVHDDSNPEGHITSTLQAVQTMAAKRP